VARVLEGEIAAFEALLNRYGPVVRGFLLRRHTSREDAEDLYQEVFVAVHRELEGLRDPSRFGPWLIRIARNKAANFRASRSSRLPEAGRQARETADALEQVADSGPTPGERASLHLVQGYVIDAIAGLNEKYRTVLYLRLIEEMPLHVIAARLDLRESTVRMRLSRGLEKLRKKLNKLGITPAGEA
jgi:RNA polymerase sigma-70 factor (ECF subfamily)